MRKIVSSGSRLGLVLSVVGHGLLGIAAASTRILSSPSHLIHVEIQHQAPPPRAATPPPPAPRPVPPPRVRPVVARAKTLLPPPAVPPRVPPPTPPALPPVADPTPPPATPAVATVPADGSGQGMTLPAGSSSPVALGPPHAGGHARTGAHAPGRGVRLGDLSGYLGDIQARLGRHRHYPEMALQLGLEGEVEVRVFVNPDGTLARPPVIAASSGHDLLDQEALHMIKRAEPFPMLPAGHGGIASLVVPVRFFLEN